MNRNLFYLALCISFIAFYTINAQSYFVIKGRIINFSDDTPLVAVNILVKELKIGTISDLNGEFVLHLPTGTQTLIFSYIGFKTEKIVISVSSNSSEILVKMREGAVDISELIITGNPLSSDPKKISLSTLSISNLDLEIKKSLNVAQILNFQPGINMRSNGTAPARPVIRGFGNNRVLILEDGLRMGDLSNSSDDHSLSSDGSLAEKIEVIRGPASLLYGSNAIGGVINVISGSISNSRLNSISGSIFSGYAVNSNERLANAHLNFGTDKLAVHSKLFFRNSDDYHASNNTKISNSGSGAEGVQFGVSFIPDFGLYGISFSKYNSEYGIPFNSFSDNDEGPIYLSMKKEEVKILLEQSELNSIVKSFSIKTGYQNYSHDEKNKKTNQIGTSFGLKSWTTDISFKHEEFTKNMEGIVGFWGQVQKYQVNGEEVITPNADYVSAAGYLYENLTINSINIQFGTRFEHNKVIIPESIVSDSLFGANTTSYNSFSGSVGAVLELNQNVSIFANAANAFRSPTVEELSSYAIHEATGTFDIGNRNLAQENNLGIDAGLRIRKDHHWVEFDVFYNQIFNFIYSEPTDLVYNLSTSSINHASISSGIPVYEYTQTNAVIYGFETKAVYEFGDGLITTVMFDYVRGKQIESNKNLPSIPPLRFMTEQRYHRDNYWIGLIWKLAASQKEVAENENVTTGYGLIDIYLGAKFPTSNNAHILNLRVDNLLDQPYRDHLSAIKSFAGMPGRNIVFNYRFLF
ncbi:MAG: TonB-dependent receptor [Bacteroidetes bacterium]|nr:TonB-dependent receptor [Bacteroidota bacterium]